ncbi:MAG: fluoride efflux transporter CrcB [Spirochaetales bacterium]|nr:fluoride efflux transporter CrcB [Spirochaetales bacterium]
MKQAMAIALGGSFGALARYYLSKWVSDLSGAGFPWGTLTVNLIGSLVIGFCFGLFEKIIIPGEVKAFITVGFLGAFTTFSTFALESVNLFREGESRLALLNLGVSMVSGLVLAVAGIMLARFLLK